jgi:hypothetical protein
LTHSPLINASVFSKVGSLSKASGEVFMSMGFFREFGAEDGQAEIMPFALLRLKAGLNIKRT